jgi:hypothetical protein
MTWVWAALIAVGVVMIAVALWPTGRGEDREGDNTEQPDNS